MADVLQTDRLHLRELDESELDAVAGLLADPEVMRYWPRPFTRAQSAAWIVRQRQQYAEDGFRYWLALRADRLVDCRGLVHRRFVAERERFTQPAADHSIGASKPGGVLCHE